MALLSIPTKSFSLAGEFGDRLALYPLYLAHMPWGLWRISRRVVCAGDLADIATALPRMNRRIGAKLIELLRLTNIALDSSMRNRLLIKMDT